MFLDIGRVSSRVTPCLRRDAFVFPRTSENIDTVSRTLNIECSVPNDGYLSYVSNIASRIRLVFHFLLLGEVT